MTHPALVSGHPEFETREGASEWFEEQGARHHPRCLMPCASEKQRRSRHPPALRGRAFLGGTDSVNNHAWDAAGG